MHILKNTIYKIIKYVKYAVLAL